jgi:hypothetical protein
MAYFVTKFVWNFAVYCGENEDIKEGTQVIRGKSRLAHKIALELMEDGRKNDM